MEGKESVTTVGEGGGGVVNWKPSSSSSSSSRPRLSLPPRPSSIEEQALFMKQSPGPMTMFLSSLLSDYVDPDAYPESECRSFSQLLAGAMSSPNAHPTTPSAMMMMKMYSPSEAALGAQNNSFHEGGVGGLGNGNGDGNGNGRELRGFKSSTPISIPIPMSPFFTVPPGFSPTTLLDSPGFLSGGQGPFGISHQQVLAQVQAQAQSQVLPQMQVQASSYPSSMSSTSTAMMPLQMEYTAGADGNAYGVSCQQKMPAQPESNKTIGCPELASQATEPNQRSLPHIYPVAERPSDDGYKWRKYGQKQVKGSEYPRSYYKCTHPKCPVKKKVERSHDGQVTEIIYKGDHNHNRKTQSSRPIANAAQQYLSDQDGRYAARGSDDKNENLDGKIDGSIQLFSGDPRGRSGINTNVSDPSTSAREHDVGQRSAEHSSDSSDDGEDDDQASRADIADDDDNKSETKRRKKEKSIKEIEALLRTSKEPRVVVQTTSDIDILDDGYRWRKYGQKVVKGNPHPRSYYKCTNVGCSVRKHVERASNDIKAVITTYEGKHNHDVPAARNSSHDTAGSGSQFHAGNNPITSSSLPKPSTISLLEQQAGNCPSSSGWTLQSRTQGQDMNSQGVKEGSLSAFNITQNYVGNMENFTSTAASNIASNQINMERPFPNDYTFTFSGAAPSRTVTPKEEQDTISVATGF